LNSFVIWQKIVTVISIGVLQHARLCMSACGLDIRGFRIASCQTVTRYTLLALTDLGQMWYREVLTKYGPKITRKFRPTKWSHSNITNNEMTCRANKKTFIRF